MKLRLQVHILFFQIGVYLCYMKLNLLIGLLFSKLSAQNCSTLSFMDHTLNLFDVPHCHGDQIIITLIDCFCANSAHHSCCISNFIIDFRLIVDARPRAL